MKTTTTSTESKTTSSKMPVPPTTTTSGYEKPADDAPEVDETPDVDDLGYDIPEDEKPKEEIIEEKKPDEDDKEVITKATGYGEEDPEEVDDKKPDEDKVKTSEDEKTDEQKAAETLEKDIDDSLGKLPEGFDKDTVKKFATDNKMTKEQVENYVKFVQDDVAQIAKENAQAVKDQRKAWSDELKNDPEFGGENFVKSIDIAEKILDKYMPNLKKVLTERGTMVPPYIMKDFLKLSKTLDPKSGLVEGEAPQVEETEINDLDAMYE